MNRIPKDVDKASLKNYDCVLVGAPTMAFRALKDIMQFLNSIDSKEFSGKLAAAFGMQIQWRLSGSSSKGIESKLKDLGFKLVTNPLITYVEGKRDEMQLKERVGKDGELGESYRRHASKIRLTQVLGKDAFLLVSVLSE